MPLNPGLFQMGAKTWRDPVTHAKFVEKEKAKRSLDKKKKDEADFAKEVEAERSNLMREKVAETGRLLVEKKQDEYLAKLKADVARLEAKQSGKKPVDPAAALAKHDKDRVANEAKEREAFVGKETKLTAQEMLKAQERELEEKKKKAEKELEELAERRRRELLDYKHALGLSSSSACKPPQRPKRFPNRPVSLHDDPEFWRLSAEDQYLLETMSPDTRAREYGFGPYEEDEVEYDPELRQRFENLGVGASRLAEKGLGQMNEKQLMEKMKQFICTEHSNVPGLLHHFPPIALNFPLDVHDPSAYEGQDRLTVEQILHQSSLQLREELCKTAILQHGANALLEFRMEGPFPVEDEAAKAQGILSELIAQGIPARVDPSAAHDRGKNVRFAGHAHHGGGGGGGGHHRQHTFGGDGLFGDGGGGGGGGGWGANVGGDWPLFGEGEGAGVGGEWGNNQGGMPGGWNTGGEGGGQWGGNVGGGGWGANAGQEQLNPWATGEGGGGGGWSTQGNNGDMWGGGQQGRANHQGGGNGGGPGGWNDWHRGGGGNRWGQGGGGLGGWANGAGGGGGIWGSNGEGGGWGMKQGGMGRDQGAFWQGGPPRGRTPRSKLQDLPANMKNLPFGAQMYIKKVRQQQEKEMREMAAAAAAGVHPTPQATAAPHFQPQPVREDPALFGNAFSRNAFPFSPHPATAPSFSPAAAAIPAALDGGPAAPPGGQPFTAAAAPLQPAEAVPPTPAPAQPATSGGLQDRLRAYFGGAQQPTVDPDHGGAGAGGWGGNPALAGGGDAAGVWQQPVKAAAATGVGDSGQGLNAAAMQALKGKHSW